MNSLRHKRFGTQVTFDFWNGNGICGDVGEQFRIAFDAIVCLIGYPKTPGLFRGRYGIAVAYQDYAGDVHFREVLSTSNEWEYRYFLEKTVAYLRKKHGAIGGEAWCVRPLKPDEVPDNNDIYRAYVVCRLFADKLPVPWFEHSQEDEAAVAFTFIDKWLIADGNEVAQISHVLRQTKLHLQDDGCYSADRSTGFRILDAHRLRFLKSTTTSGGSVEDPQGR